MKLTAMVLGSLFMVAAEAGSAPPQTLATLAGAKPEAGRLSDSVLIIIDAQREYVDGALPLANVDNALSEIGKLLARARKAGTPIIHIMHRGSSLFDPASPYFEIVAPLHPVSGETVIEKRRTSAFADTRLGDIVRATGRKHLIIVGFMTHNCVSSTARAAHDLGYKVTVVSTASATRDLPDGRGGVVPASILQTASIAELSDATAVVVEHEGDIPD